jgi:hypothetical protein
MGPVYASISDEDTYKSLKPLTNEKGEVTQPGNLVEFKQIKVNVSTRMTPIHLKFSCNISDKNGKEEIAVKSTLTNPIIVITNESQWREAASKVLALDAFSGQVLQSF